MTTIYLLCEYGSSRAVFMEISSLSPLTFISSNRKSMKTKRRTSFETSDDLTRRDSSSQVVDSHSYFYIRDPNSACALTFREAFAQWIRLLSTCSILSHSHDRFFILFFFISFSPLRFVVLTHCMMP